jgi:hypothetical protein
MLVDVLMADRVRLPGSGRLHEPRLGDRRMSGQVSWRVTVRPVVDADPGLPEAAMVTSALTFLPEEFAED